MERVRRVNGFGTHEVDPENNADYHVSDENRATDGIRRVTAIPAVRFHPLEEIQNRLDNNYIPVYNEYKRVKVGQNWEVKVTPKPRIPIDIDFGWHELCEQTRNVVHDATIPSAGFFFKHADVMPDLQIKLVNSTPKVMGFKPQERNKGVFDRANMQIMYNQAGKAINFTANHFVFPAIDPTFALVGCKDSFIQEIWNHNKSPRENATGQDFIDKIKQLGMIISSNIKDITLNYKVISKWTHTAEIVIQFIDEYEFME